MKIKEQSTLSNTAWLWPLLTLGVTLAGVSFLLMFHIGKLDNSNKALKKTVEKMEQVDDSFHSILKMERMKEDYRKQGILEEGL